MNLSGNITEAEHLPVAALHFGDTGTPFDDKEGRYVVRFPNPLAPRYMSVGEPDYRYAGWGNTDTKERGKGKE